MTSFRRPTSYALAFVLAVATLGGCSSCEETTSTSNATASDAGDGWDVSDDVGDVSNEGDGGDAAQDAGDDSPHDGGDTDGGLDCPHARCDGRCCESASEVCLSDNCVEPGDDCEVTEDCPVDDYCEPTLGQCVPRDQVDVCEYIPPTGEFEPTVGCSWPAGTPDVNPTSTHVVTAPVVANLTDDNGDGKTDTEDVPELVFLTRETGPCCNRPGTLRIVSGECNEDGSMDEIASLTGVQMVNDGAPAVGDLTGNGIPEIAVISHNGGPNATTDPQQPQGVVVWTRAEDDNDNWEVLWRNPDYPTRETHTPSGGMTINIADLEGDGKPEVIVGNVVLNGQNGDLKWDGTETVGEEAGIGNNSFLGPTSSVADVDLDGDQEIAAGNTLYDHDGGEIWTYEFDSSASVCHGAESTNGRVDCDGYTAIANFDDDPEGEVVIVRQGEVFIIDDDGSLMWKQAVPWDDCVKFGGQKANESGPPTVADFDGDGDPEIGTAGADFYAVLDPECDDDPVPDGCRSRGVLWATPNQDCSSRATASSVFDFEGDGKAEMVYADETTFRIIDGTDGSVLFQDDSHDSNTRIEMPLVADVDNDRNSEVVVPSATGQGIKVWTDRDDNWVRTRRIWNQHAYSVTNVTEEGIIPRDPQPNWQNGRLNNFRQNIQPGGLFDAPDLVVDDVSLVDSCVGQDEIEVEVTVANEGAVGEPAGIPVAIFAEHDGSRTDIDTVDTADRLLPGESETVSTTWTVPDRWWSDGFSLGATIDPDEQINECDEENNETSRDAEDLTGAHAGIALSRFDVQDGSCGVNQQISIDLTVENTDQETFGSDIPVVLEATHDGDTEEIDTLYTSGELTPGDSEDLSTDWAAGGAFFGEEFEITATIDPDREVLDCPPTEAEERQVDCTPEG